MRRTNEAGEKIPRNRIFKIVLFAPWRRRCWTVAGVVVVSKPLYRFLLYAEYRTGVL